MKDFAAFLIGVATCLIAHTLFGSASFYALACAYTAALYLLFFYSSYRRALTILLGISFGQEVFGLAHVGLAITLGMGIILLHQLFGLRLRFTSLILRYEAALILALIAYGALLFPVVPSADLLHRWGQLGILYAPLAVISYLASTLRAKPTYELI